MRNPLLDWMSRTAGDAEATGHLNRRDVAVAVVDEGSNEDAVEADAEVKATARTEVIQVDELKDVNEPAKAETDDGGDTGPAAEPGPGDEARLGDDLAETSDTKEPIDTVAAAVTEALPTADLAGAVEPAAGADAASAQAGDADENPAPTLVDTFPPSVAGGARRLSWKGTRRHWTIATAAAAAAVLVIALVIVATHASNMSTVANHKASHQQKVVPVSVVSVSPGNGSTGVNGTSPITVTYSGPINKDTPLPTLSPSIAGNWQVSRDTATFTPQVGFAEDTHVTVTIPASASTTTTAATSFSFTTGHYSVLRLDELLSQLGYIPVTWTPTDSAGNIPTNDPSAQLAAAYDPPAGTFSFAPGYPSTLTGQWSAGTDNEIVDGAIRTFEFDQNLAMDGIAGPRVWSHLLTAIARGERNHHGYTYVLVSQAGTETLDLYHDGRLAITSPVNTGIAASPTVDGTFPVYLRYTVTQMIGTNPDGSPYDDTVYWVSYFNGGDAVHAFPRASYGWYQSLGCVELPTYGSTAEDVWNLITYGTLVTVTGPVA